MTSVTDHKTDVVVGSEVQTVDDIVGGRDVDSILDIGANDALG